MGDMATLDKKIYIWSTTHNPRTFVDKVDFLAAPGYLDGGDAREKLGLKNGPELVITDLCVMDFEPTSKRMRLKSVHHGITPKQVQEKTGFELLMPVECSGNRSRRPKSRCKSCARRLIRRSMRKLEFRGSETKV